VHQHQPPNRAPKKIARANGAPTVNGTRYQVIWDMGKLLPGSSGSPLFNGTKRVIGPACCVSDFSCSQWADYGRFEGFWDIAGLGRWLDPLGTDPQGIDGFDPIFGQVLVYDGSGANPLLYSSTTMPTLGTTWVASIDTSSIPVPVTTWIVGQRAPSAGRFLPWGELLVDTSTQRVFASFAASSGGVAVHSNPIPNLPILVGRKIYTQAMILVGTPAVMTNGIELRLR
jgi:hypothetical protein